MEGNLSLILTQGFLSNYSAFPVKKFHSEGVVPENIHTFPQRMVTEIRRGMGVWKRQIFEGKGCRWRVLFPECLKCDRINTYVLFPIDNNTLNIFHFKDRTVFSLNSTGTFSDGIIRAVIRLRSFYTHIIPVNYSFPRTSKPSRTRLSSVISVP